MFSTVSETHVGVVDRRDLRRAEGAAVDLDFVDDADQPCTGGRVAADVEGATVEQRAGAHCRIGGGGDFDPVDVPPQALAIVAIDGDGNEMPLTVGDVHPRDVVGAR